MYGHKGMKMYESIHEWPLYRAYDEIDGGNLRLRWMTYWGDRQNLGTVGDLGENNCDPGGQKRNSFGILS